jgi:hypothetical protein
MIAERPKIHRAFLAAVIVAFLLVLLVLIFLATKKKTEPQQEPPLHPGLFAVQEFAGCSQGIWGVNRELHDLRRKNWVKENRSGVAHVGASELFAVEHTKSMARTRLWAVRHGDPNFRNPRG